MKKIFILFVVFCACLGCEKTEPRTSYVYNGTAKEVYNGIRVYLNTSDTRGRLKPLDTAIVMNESFVFEGSVEHPKMVMLTLDGTQGRYPMMLENNEASITLDKSNIQNTTITGSTAQDKYKQFADDIKAVQSEMTVQGKAYNQARYSGDSTAIDVELEKLKSIRTRLMDIPYEFMENNPKEFLSLELYEMQSKARERDDERLISIFESFDETLKMSRKGKQLNASVIKLKADVEANKHLQIGMKAPDFSGPDPDGNKVVLSEITDKAKVTIVDFWAAWCGPCRRENPNVVRIYNAYHDQGLEIIGVSLDGQAKQKEPKKAWLDAIAQDKLTWNHVSHLKYFNDPIAKTYNISAIPATYILDENGNIAAKNLRGYDLELKVKELLGIKEQLNDFYCAFCFIGTFFKSNFNFKGISVGDLFCIKQIELKWVEIVTLHDLNRF